MKREITIAFGCYEINNLHFNVPIIWRILYPPRRLSNPDSRENDSRLSPHFDPSFSHKLTEQWNTILLDTRNDHEIWTNFGVCPKRRGDGDKIVKLKPVQNDLANKARKTAITYLKYNLLLTNQNKKLLDKKKIIVYASCRLI